MPIPVRAHGSRGGDISGPGLTTVLQAIGNATLAGHAQPIDVLALQELNTSRSATTGTPSVTLDYIVDQLNGIYGAGTYKADTVLDPTTGGTGGGPSGLIYNTTTVQLLDADVIGSASGSGAARAPMRYELAPLGFNDHSADFWLYVSHAKSGTGTTNENRRNVEANTIRTNAATLGTRAHIIYSGDYNTTANTEAGYQTMISASVAGGVGQAVDTVNPANNWNTSSTFSNLLTESATSLQFRDDFQFVTAPMLNAPGLQLVPNSYTPFGNNGTTYHTTVASANNTALADLGQSPYTPAYRASVLTALTSTTDHLPIVADYSFASVIHVPPTLVGDYNGNGIVDAADFTVWQDTFGQVVTVGTGADGDGSGTIDQGDYDAWATHFGETTPGSGSGATSNAAVPEPGAFALLLFGGCLLGLSVGRLKGWTRRN